MLFDGIFQLSQASLVFFFVCQKSLLCFLGLLKCLLLAAQFLISTAFPMLLISSGPALTLVLYATAGAISFFFVLFLVKETCGKELEEVV